MLQSSEKSKTHKLRVFYSVLSVFVPKGQLVMNNHWIRLSIKAKIINAKVSAAESGG